MFTEPFLTAKDIAKMLKISNALAYRLIQNGQISGVRFGRTVRVRQEDLEKFIAENLTNKNTDHPNTREGVSYEQRSK